MFRNEHYINIHHVQWRRGGFCFMDKSLSPEGRRLSGTSNFVQAWILKGRPWTISLWNDWSSYLVWRNIITRCRDDAWMTSRQSKRNLSTQPHSRCGGVWIKMTIWRQSLISILSRHLRCSQLNSRFAHFSLRSPPLSLLFSRSAHFTPVSVQLTDSPQIHVPFNRRNKLTFLAFLHLSSCHTFNWPFPPQIPSHSHNLHNETFPGDPPRSSRLPFTAKVSMSALICVSLVVQWCEHSYEHVS